MSTRYDYVIVGAGSAGCVLANRLSADPSTNVLLLEAGEPDNREEISDPGGFAFLAKSSVDWDYETTPQPGLNGRTEYWPRGKTLGGSSSINAAMYVRGHPTDFDHWADLGNEGWGWNEMLERYKRLEDHHLGPSPYHGAGGPVRVERVEWYSDVSEALLDAAVEVGFERNRDINGERQEGIGHVDITKKGTERQSTAVAYLHPVLDRDNLTARTGAHVTQITFDGTRASGVEYVEDGTPRMAEGEEIILSAGAIESPRLLMLSGIGDPDHLDEHGIDVFAALPGVGQNLQDHLLTHVVYDATETIKFGPGSNLAENTGFERSEPGLDAPDLQFFATPAYFMNHGFDNPEGSGMSIGVTQVRPNGRGRVTLAADNPFEDPVIDPNYLEDSTDLEQLVAGIRRAREIGQASALDPYRGEERWPGSDVQTDSEIAEHIRNTAQTVYHPVGTCAMGDHDLAVVDDRLRVRGVENLRVIDASVMPRITGGNTNAPTIAIAERAADFF